ncbi:peptidoglycan DD-metalloendopeptidase family protein [bacterium]|nr:peptidoglycan DD-metalloendopeptidase family protein [bacterium]MBU1615170.1 peptidoglycan DD-metalloendopeptidase family protein [bacterium]
MRQIFILLFFVILFFDLAYAAKDYSKEIEEHEEEIKQEERKLKNVQREITDKKYNIAKVREEEKQALGELNQIERKRNKTWKEITGLNRNLLFSDRKIRKTKKELEKTKESLKERQDLLGTRLKVMYKQGRRGPFQVLLLANNFTDFLKRLKFLKVIARSDLELIRGIRKTKEEIEKKERELEAENEELLQTTSKKKVVLSREKQEEKEQKGAVSKVKNKKALYLRQLKELETASKDIGNLINALEGKKKELHEQALLGKTDFDKKKGSLPWPINSKTVIRPFGKYKHPEFNAWSKNKGIDIKGSPGAQVWTVSKGVVVFADWFKGYGQLVMIDHGGGYYTLYGGLDEISVAVDDEVEALAEVGKLTNEASLHFEVRLKGTPVDPLKWLKR